MDLNATQAAVRAGYSERASYSMGQRLLNNVAVQKTVQKATEQRSHRTEITQNWVLEELQKIASANRAAYMAMAKSMGLSMDAASDMAINVAKLSGDVASFYNVSQEVAALIDTLQ